MNVHVFVAMPYGVREGTDFDAIYDELIKKPLTEKGYSVFRADEERRAGEIRSDMFQELLLADLVVVDLSTHNPNVWYELGIRHALRARGILPIRCQGSTLPFDVHTDRTLRYHVKDGRPDPAFVEQDRAALVAMAEATLRAWHGQKVSPVYHHLPFLSEPDWKSLRVAGARQIWEVHEKWLDRIRVARRKNLAGDILVLADEGSTRVLEPEACRAAARALLGLGQFALAQEQIDEALALDPENLDGRQVRGIVLGRLGRWEEAEVWLRRVVEDFPKDAESWALLGRVYKDQWLPPALRESGGPEARRIACENLELLENAIEAYARGFREDARHYYSGINALGLQSLYRHLSGKDTYEAERRQIEGGVRWAIRCALSHETPTQKDYWARASLADLEALVSDAACVLEAYRKSAASAEGNWFNLDSARQGLRLLQVLEFRPAEVSPALLLLEAELKKTRPPTSYEKVFLFSGHMVDRKDRATPRFPASRVPDARKRIAAELARLGAGSGDLALCGGACGGDLLFAEECLKLNLTLEVRLPFQEPEFLQKSVAFAGDEWVWLYQSVKANPKTRVYVMPQELGPAPEGVNPYARNNLWQLYTAWCRGPERLRFLCLWDGGTGDGPGGTEHMMKAALKRHGIAQVIDVRELKDA